MQNKIKALAVDVLRELFDQSKKILKNTFYYLTIFAIVLSSTFTINISAAIAATVAITNGETVSSIDADGDGTSDDILQSGDTYVSTGTNTFNATGDIEIAILEFDAAGSVTTTVINGTMTIGSIAVTDDAAASTLVINTGGNLIVTGAITNDDAAVPNNLIIKMIAGRTLEFQGTNTIDATIIGNGADQGILKIATGASTTINNNIGATDIALLDVDGTLVLGTISVDTVALDLDGTITSTASSSVNVTGVSNFDGAAVVTTGGAQTYTGAATIAADTVLTTTANSQNGNIIFGNTLQSASGETNDLTLNMGSGTVQFVGAVGGTDGFGTIDINGNLNLDANITNTGSINVSGTTNIAANIDITTSGSQVYVGTLTLASGTSTLDAGTSADSDITLAAISGVAGDDAENITLDAGGLGDIIIAGAVTNVDTITITEASNLLISGALSIQTLTIDGNTDSVQITGGGSIADQMRFDNATSVTINDAIGTDTMTFTGGLIVETPTSLTISETIATTNQTMTLGDGNTGITLAGNTTLNAGNGALNINGAVTGGNNSLALNTTGTTTIGAAITGITTLTTNANGTTVINANVSSSGTQTYNDNVTLSGAARTLTSTSSGAIFFDGTIDGTQDLTVATDGLTTFDGLVGNTTILGAIDISGAGGLDLDAAIVNTDGSAGAASLDVNGATNLGANVVTAGAQTYGGTATVSTDVTLDSTGDQNTDDISLAAVIGAGGTEDLILDAGALAQITASGSITNLTDISIRDSGGATFGGAVTASNDFIISESAGDIIFNGALTAGTFTQTADANTAYNLEFNAGGTITDAVNFSNAGTVTIGDGTGTDTMTFTGGLIVETPTALTLAETIATTNQTMTLGDGNTGITLAGNTTLNAGSGALNINGAVTGGGFSLALNTTGTTTIGAAITGITTLTTDGAANAIAINADVSSSGTQTYNDNVTLSGAARTLTSTSSGAIFFDGTIDGTQDLTVATDGLTTFDGLVGNTTILGAIDISGAGGLDLDAAIVNTDGSAGAASLDVNGASNLGANVVTAGAQTYTGTATVSTDVTLDSTGDQNTDDISLAAVIGAGGTEDLILDAGALAQITASGSITNLTDISIRDSGGATFGGAVTAGNDFIISESAGDIIFNGALTAGTFTQTADANTAYNLEFNAGGTITDATTLGNAGTVSIGADGTTTQFTGGLISIAGSSQNLNGTIKTIDTNMTISDGEAITLSGSTTLSSIGTGVDGNDGNITLGGIVNSATEGTDETLTVDVGTGTFQIGGIVGGVSNKALGAIDINNTGGNLDLNAAITLAASIDVSGNSNLGESITTSGAQTYGGTATVSTDVTLDSTGDQNTDDISLAAVIGAGGTEDLILDAGALAQITASGSITNLTDISIRDSGGATFGGAVTASNDFIISESAGDIIFNGALTAGTFTQTADANTAYNLEFNAGGTITDAVNFSNAGTVTIGDGTGTDT